MQSIDMSLEQRPNDATNAARRYQSAAASTVRKLLVGPVDAVMGLHRSCPPVRALFQSSGVTRGLDIFSCRVIGWCVAAPSSTTSSSDLACFRPSPAFGLPPRPEP